jgi:hypothetical protein
LDALPVVLCPGCKVKMAVILVEPMTPGARMDEVTYRCPQCDTETKRQYSRQAASRNSS